MKNKDLKHCPFCSGNVHMSITPKETDKGHCPYCGILLKPKREREGGQKADAATD